MADERDGYPPGVPCWIDTAQPDQDAAMRFYGGLFDWEFEDRMPAGTPNRYFVATLDGHDVAGIGAKLDETPTAWSTYVWVGSADETAAKARDAGGTVIVDPFDVPPDAGRMAAIADPAGAVFCVWEARARKGAQLVNAPGTWNSGNLNTPDPEGAKAFYGALFGWESGDLGESTMWTLPGYGDFLEASDPDFRRELEEEFHAPPGFDDMVAWLAPQPNGGSVPPHWSVTFTVEDPDATAAKAAELGGAIVAPPFDAGPVRLAVVRDPHDAVLTVGRYG